MDHPESRMEAREALSQHDSGLYFQCLRYAGQLTPFLPSTNSRGHRVNTILVVSVMWKLSHPFLRWQSRTPTIWDVNQISCHSNTGVYLLVCVILLPFKVFPVYIFFSCGNSLITLHGHTCWGCQGCWRTSALLSAEALVCWDPERLVATIQTHLFVITGCPYTSPFCQHNYSQSCEYCPDKTRDPLPCQLQFQSPCHSSPNILTLLSAPRSREFDSKSSANGSHF